MCHVTPVRAHVTNQVHLLTGVSEYVLMSFVVLFYIKMCWSDILKQTDVTLINMTLIK